MLPQQRCAAILQQATRRAVRRASTVAEHTSSSAAPPPPRQLRSYQRRTGTIFVRPWDGIQSMPEVFAIVRAIERKYGKVRDFHAQRDFDYPEHYTPWFTLEFIDPSVTSEIAKEGSHTMLSIEVPVVDRSIQGGISLDDIREYLDSGDKVEGVDEGWQSVTNRMAGEVASKSEEGKKPTKRTIDVKLELANNPIRYRTYPEYPDIKGPKLLDIGVAFARWGGFYIPPQSAVAEATTTEVTEESEVGPDSSTSSPSRPISRMARAQKQWQERLQAERHRRPDFRKADDSLSPQESLEASSDEAPEGPENAAVESHESVSTETAAPTSPETPSTHTEPTSEHEEPAAQHTPQLTRRQRMLIQAREMARTPLPAEITDPEVEAEAYRKKQQEKEEKRLEKHQTMASVKERLLKLMGGKWF